MIFIIDRFEGKFAVCECENQQMIDILKTLLPEEAKEGTKVEYKDGKYQIVDNSDDKKRIKNKMNNLFK